MVWPHPKQRRSSLPRCRIRTALAWSICEADTTQAYWPTAWRRMRVRVILSLPQSLLFRVQNCLFLASFCAHVLKKCECGLQRPILVPRAWRAWGVSADLALWLLVQNWSQLRRCVMGHIRTIA